MGKCWTYTEIITKYSVDNRKFRRLIKPIIDELVNMGYVTGQRTFTPKQVKCIFDYLD